MKINDAFKKKFHIIYENGEILKIKSKSKHIPILDVTQHEIVFPNKNLSFSIYYNGVLKHNSHTNIQQLEELPTLTFVIYV